MLKALPKNRTLNSPNYAEDILQISEPTLDAGMYFYRVIVNGQIQHTGKVVIMR